MFVTKRLLLIEKRGKNWFCNENKLQFNVFLRTLLFLEAIKRLGRFKNDRSQDFTHNGRAGVNTGYWIKNRLISKCENVIMTSFTVCIFVKYEWFNFVICVNKCGFKEEKKSNYCIFNANYPEMFRVFSNSKSNYFAVTDISPKTRFVSDKVFNENE